MRRNHLLTGAALLALAAGCDNAPPVALEGVPAIVYIQRGPADTGNVFDYTSGAAGANLFTLTPPTASGVKKNLTNWQGADINAIDLSFDARELAFSARAPGDTNYHVYRMNVDGTNPCDAAAGKITQGPCQITAGPNDQVYPIYLPGGRLLFVTNENVEGPYMPQFRDEYERATTAQVATIALDGSGLVLGPRNVSHRVSPTLLSDGRVLLTEWRHLGDVNEGDLTLMSQDMTGVREAFGREGNGRTNAYLRAREVSPGQVVVIGTSRDRTFQAGKLLLVNLGGPSVETQSEAHSTYVDLTPDVPGDRTPSFTGVGRYYDVAPVDATGKKLLVTWSDGPVESEVLAMAKAQPQFGIYVYDTASKTRFPLVNDPGMWDVSPLPIIKRAEPAALKPSFAAEGTQSTLVSAINVFNSTMFPNMQAGTIKKVRITEGFSSEEGVPNMFGLTEFDGQARLGEIDLQPDGSFKAVIPANTPVRVQLIDKYGLALKTSGPGGGTASEPIWIQGRAGEARVCGGCHEDRTQPIQLAPGSSVLQALGAAQLDYAGQTRAQRVSTVYTADKVMGVPWDKALQPIFDRACVDCHDGTAGAANPSYTIVDLTDMVTFSFTFDLTSKAVSVNTGEMMYTYSASHVSLMGPDMLFREKQIMITMGAPKEYVSPGSAYDSVVVQMLNPPARYPAIDLNDRAFGAAPQHPAEVGVINGHDGADPKYQLTPDEYFLIGLMADNGGQFYSRENAPGGMY
jgi:Hydrazine synthase alpha subunit middle domain